MDIFQISPDQWTMPTNSKHLPFPEGMIGAILPSLAAGQLCYPGNVGLGGTAITFGIGIGMLRVGLNPYGLTYHLGLQGRGTPRVNPNARGLEGFIDIATELGARTLEIFEPWLAGMDDDALGALRDTLRASV